MILQSGKTAARWTGELVLGMLLETVSVIVNMHNSRQAAQRLLRSHVSGTQPTMVALHSPLSRHTISIAAHAYLRLSH